MTNLLQNAKIFLYTCTYMYMHQTLLSAFMFESLLLKESLFLTEIIGLRDDTLHNYYQINTQEKGV